MDHTYDGDGLDAQRKQVAGEVTGVGQGIFFPEHSKQRVLADKTALEVDEVACGLISKNIHFERRMELGALTFKTDM